MSLGRRMARAAASFGVGALFLVGLLSLKVPTGVSGGVGRGETTQPPGVLGRFFDYLAVLVGLGGESGARVDLAGAIQPLLTSLLVVVPAVLLVGVIGTLLGIASADRRPVASRVARVVSWISFVPTLVWTILVFQVLVALGITTGIWSGAEGSAPSSALELLVFVAAPLLPILIGDALLADTIERVRIETRRIRASPHMTFARASGMNETRHLLLGLVPGIAEVIVSRSLFLLVGLIVVETQLSIRGLGREIVNQLSRFDGSLQGVVDALVIGLALALVAWLLRVAKDVAVVRADPRRARVEQGAG